MFGSDYMGCCVQKSEVYLIQLCLINDHVKGDRQHKWDTFALLILDPLSLIDLLYLPFYSPLSLNHPGCNPLLFLALGLAISLIT